MRLGLAGLVLMATPLARAQDRQVLHGHVPRAIADLNLQPMGLLPGTNRLHLAIGLPLRNQEALTDLLQQIYDPGSPVYHQYLTPEQFAEKFGPTEPDYQAVIAFAKANGFTVTGTHPNRVLLDVNGSVADIEKVFHLTMRVYQHPTEARTFYAPDTDPSIDLAVPLSGISGLDNYMVPHPMIHRTPLNQVRNVTPNAGSGPDGLYMGYDFRAAYVPGVALNGSGQAVALLEMDGYYTNDITAYESRAGLPNVTLTNVLVDGYSGTSGVNNVEVALDIDMAICMAPGLSKVIVYESLTNWTDYIDMLNRMATDNLAKQLSSSWAWTGVTKSLLDATFQQFATQRQSFFNASGDSGAYVGTTPTPVDDPYITVVGGTMLTTSGPTNNWVSETTWSYSSGGISTIYAIPSWQQGVSMTNNQGSTTMRNLPDIALTADNIFLIADNGKQGSVAGTSCAAPLWAGFTALVNQQGAANGKSPVGFLNPAIYTIGTGTTYAACFHDITTGNNEWTGSPKAYTATTGYDLCTGWGTPTGTNLIYALAGTPANLVVTPANLNYGTLIVGQSSNQTFSVINAGQATVSGTATVVTAGSPFAIVSGSPYAVNGGQTGTVTVSFSPTAAGSFSNTVAFNGNGGVSSNAVTGAALTPAHLNVSPSSQNFGPVATGTTAQTSFVVTNTGGATLSATASVSGVFAIVSGSSYNVAGLGSTNVIVSFTPPSVNSFTGSVIFASTGGNSTNIVTGRGAVVPVASFSANTTNGVAPLTVMFTNSSSGTITNQFWEFGDNTTSNTTATTVAHTYSSAGTDTVTLIVSGLLSVSTNTRLNYVTVLTTYQSWQMHYFDCTDCPEAAPDADPLGTGMSNTNQFLAGFNPTNSAAYLHIISIAITNTTEINVIYLGANGDSTWSPGVASRTNVLDYTTGDASGNYTNGGWQDTGQTNILSGGTGTGIVTNMVDSGGATNTPSRFYRVRVLVP